MTGAEGDDDDLGFDNSSAEQMSLILATLCKAVNPDINFEESKDYLYDALTDEDDGLSVESAEELGTYIKLTAEMQETTIQ